jgi:hypothetical protein
MPRLRFKNFSDLGFIQRIDKPKHLVPLLTAHRDYFLRQGIDISNLNNGDETDRKLLEVFTQPDEEMPPDLLEALYVLDDLADEAGHDQILTEAERRGINFDGMPDDMSPGEFAIAVYRNHPELIRGCHEKITSRKIKNFQEYQAKDDKGLSFSAAKKKRKQLEDALAPWFEKMNRSRACEIYIYEEGREIKFVITHGRPYRTDGSINKSLRRSRIAYRPQKHDMVTFDKETHILKINATQTEKEAYRKTFGQVLFEDDEYFPPGDIYTLEPLRKGKEALKLVVGIESATLTELWVQLDAERGFNQVSKSRNLMDSIEEYQNPDLAEGKFLRASFLVKYSSGGRARRLELKPPNIAIYDRERDGDATEAFLKTNGYIKKTNPPEE